MQAESAPEETAAAAYRSLPVPSLVDYALNEPNAYVLDVAEFALDDGEYHPAQELLRADNVLRAELGWPSRQGAVAQPWTVVEEKTVHTVRLRFTVECVKAFENVKLALEDAELAKLTLNGQPVEAHVDGWFVDTCIGTIPLPKLVQGTNVLTVELPFGRRTNVEWCYLLGDFGVTRAGAHRELVERPQKLGFGDVTRQNLPHYTGNISYEIPMETRGGKLRVTAPHYTGAAIRVSLDGEQRGFIVYPPYALELDASAGAHTLTLTVLGNRNNAFGPLHRADVTNSWIGPDAWRTTGAMWTDSYWVKPLGLRTSPQIEEAEL